MLGRKATLITLAVFLISASTSYSTESAKSITIMTTDGKKLGGTLYSTPSASTKPPCVVVLPDTRCDKDPYEGFASRLNQAGFTVLVLDFRFKDLISRARNREEAVKLIQEQDLQTIVDDDIKSAMEFLVKQEVVDTGRIGFLGSSLGARVALVAATRYEVAALTLISLSGEYALPGGKRVEELLSVYGNKPVLFMTSEKDWGGNYKAAEHNRLYFEWAKGKKELKIWPGSGHGPDIVNTDQAADFIKEWLRRNL